MRIAALVLVIAACGKSAPDEPAPAGSGSAVSKRGRMRAVMQVPHATLVAGHRHIVVTSPDHWLVADGKTLKNLDEVADQVAKLSADLGELQIFVAASPVVVGGEEHHEEMLRLARGPIDVPGHLVRTAAFDDGVEIWQYEDKLHAKLATVGIDGKLAALPELALAGKPIAGDSPVRAKQCAAPAIADLASTGTAISALVVECDPDAAVRIATYAKGARVPTIEALGQLGFVPTKLAVARDRRVIAGLGGGKLVIRDGTTTRTGTADVTVLASLALAADGALWTLTLAGDTAQVTRDGELVPIVDTTGTPLRPTALAFDDSLGIVVLATARDTTWIFAER